MTFEYVYTDANKFFIISIIPISLYHRYSFGVFVFVFCKTCSYSFFVVFQDENLKTIRRKMNSCKTFHRRWELSACVCVCMLAVLFSFSLPFLFHNDSCCWLFCLLVHRAEPSCIMHIGCAFTVSSGWDLKFFMHACDPVAKSISAVACAQRFWSPRKFHPKKQQRLCFASTECELRILSTQNWDWIALIFSIQFVKRSQCNSPLHSTYRPLRSLPREN